MISDMMILLMIIIFTGFAVAARMSDKKELERRQKQEIEIKKLKNLIRDLQNSQHPDKDI